MKKIGPWKIKSSKTVYENPWLEVFHEEVLTPANTDGIYGRIHFKNHATGIIPISNDGYTWIVGQHRYPLDTYSWEIPQGGCPEGTDILETAKRELEEETGLIAASWEKIAELDLSNSVTDEQGTIYVAKGLSEGVQKPEETEELLVKKIKIEELFNMVMSGEITDGMSIVGTLKLMAINHLNQN